MQWWENGARKILTASGYPLEWKALSRTLMNGDHPRQIHDIESMLWHFDSVRKFLAKNEIESAVWHMALAIQAGMKAKIRPIEPVVDMGERYGETKARGPRRNGPATA